MSDQATLRQGSRVLRLLEEAGLDRKQIQSLVEGGFLVDLLAAVKKGSLDPAQRERIKRILGLYPLEVVEKKLVKLTIDYSKSYAQMFIGDRYEIEDRTKPNDTYRGLSEHGRKTRGEKSSKKDIVAALVKFDRKFFDIHEAQQGVLKGFRPAEIEELLAFGTSYQDIDPVITVATSQQCYLGVKMILCAPKDKRYFFILPDNGWGEDFRFLYVSK